MEKVIRFGVSINPKLLERFDNIIKEKGYTNRSEAIRDLIRKKLIEDKTMNPDAEAFGALTIIYDHHIRNIKNRLMETQHNHLKEILSTTHVHIDRNNCLEVIVLRGKTGNIKKLSDNIISTGGVKHGKLVITDKIF